MGNVVKIKIRLTSRDKYIIKKLKQLLMSAVPFIAFIAITYVCWFFLGMKYPQRIISAEELLSASTGGSSGFVFDENGRLVSTSGDPWVSFEWNDDPDIYTINVKLNEVIDGDSDSTRAELYLFYEDGSYRYYSKTVSAGDNSFFISSNSELTSIRFDLAVASDVIIDVDEIVVNGHISILKIAMNIAIYIFVFALMVIAFLYLLKKRINYSEIPKSKRGYYRIFAILLGIELCLLFIVINGYSVDSIFAITSNNLGLTLLILEGISLISLFLHITQKRMSFALSLPVIVLLSLAQFILIENLSCCAYGFSNTDYTCINLAIYMIPSLILLVVFRRIFFAISIPAIVYALLGIANHYYGQFRSNPLLFSDIINAGTAANVISEYDLSLNSKTVYMLLFGIGTCLVFCNDVGFKKLSYKTLRYNIVKIGALVVVILGLSYYVSANVPDFSSTNKAGWAPTAVTSSYGYAFTFAGYVKAMTVEAPDGYSAATVNEILSEYSDSDAVTSTPNIIIIMNESFADLPDIFGFETNEDVLPFIHSLIGTENVISGTLLTSSIGGGTANTEFEFLTGNSLYTLPLSCSPYGLYISSKQQSIAWRLSNLGYSTNAYHPYKANGYRRNANYPLLGFSSYYFLDTSNLPYAARIRSYISDSSDFANVIYLYENREEDSPFFMFNVTMQNHGGYQSGLENIYPLDENLQTAALKEYLTLINATDAAFAELIEYFSNVEEDTIILMFGDHQPGIDGILVGYGSSDDQAKYRSSFIIWANFDIDEATDVATSANYLSALLFEQAGLELTAYEEFLLDLYEEYPAMNAFGYYDSDGNWHERETAEEGTLLWQYCCMVYNNIFDKKSMIEEYFIGN